MANSKARYDAALFTKLLLHDNTLQNLKIISTKPKFLFGNYFRKAQILIWHYFIKPKNIILATIFTLFHKAQILIWQLS